MENKQEEAISEALKVVIQNLMEGVMNRVLKTNPFIPEKHRAERPLYAALVPDEIFKGSHFERRFVTPFGKAWERLAVVLAQHILGKGELGHIVKGTVKTDRLRRISEVLNSLEHGEGKDRRRPNWNEEIDYVLKGKGPLIPTTVICDVYAEDVQTGRKYAFELKAPLPNSDQTKVSKEKIFKLLAMEPRIIDEAFYALPYNPYGKRENYAWSFPARWFDMKNDPVVLIGDEFWDKLGGLGTYKRFIQEINKLGKGYRYRIYKEYLGIEPPEDFSEEVL